MEDPFEEEKYEEDYEEDYENDFVEAAPTKDGQFILTVYIIYIYIYMLYSR